MTRQRRYLSLVLIVLCTFQAFAGGRSSHLRLLYESHQWFRLREEVAQTKASNFYRGVVAAVFNQQHEAEKLLQSVINAEPNSEQAYQARELLVGVYSRNGRYREASNQVEAMLAHKPDSAGALNVRDLLRVLGQSPDQSVVEKKLTRVSITTDDGNLVLPVAVDGVSARYILDTGFNISGVSESEAKRLGLVVHDINTKADSMTGAQVHVRVAVANSLVVGNMRLSHVAFVVLPDGQPPFNELPEDRRGILGIPVLMALQTLRWTRTELDTGFPTKHLNLRQANLSFEGTFPLAQVAFQGRPLQFTLDTGAQNTDLYPQFARQFSEVLTSGQKELHTLTGVGGSADFESIVLPSLQFQVGRNNLDLQPAHVLMKETNSTSKWFAGNLGMDLLLQPAAVTLDFPSMRFTLQ